MPNIASVLKEEITRVVRKELRSETESLKKASGRYRTDIAALKRRIDGLEKQISRLEKMAPSKATVVAGEETDTKHRFKPEGFQAHRTRLGLSGAQMGALIGVSAKTIYNWEAGSPRPRAGHLAAIAAVRKMGKREAMEKLEAIQAKKG